MIWWGFRYTHNSFTSYNDDLTSPSELYFVFSIGQVAQTDTEQLLALSDKLTGVLLPQTQNFRLSRKTLANNLQFKDGQRESQN